MRQHDWETMATTPTQHCRRCDLWREMAGAWWQYARGWNHYGIISPAPPCDRAWPTQAPGAATTGEKR